MERKIKARFVVSYPLFIKHVFLNFSLRLLLIVIEKRISLWLVSVAFYNGNQRRLDNHYLVLVFLWIFEKVLCIYNEINRIFNQMELA